MLSNFTVGLFAGAGVSAWVYNKIMRSTGGRTKDALIVAASAGVGTCVLLAGLLSAFF